LRNDFADLQQNFCGREQGPETDSLKFNRLFAETCSHPPGLHLSGLFARREISQADPPQVPQHIHCPLPLTLPSIVPLSFTLKSIQQMMGRPTPITWNHRVLLIEEHGEKSYCIHEVHYDEDGSVMGWTQNAIAVFVPSFAELILM